MADANTEKQPPAPPDPDPVPRATYHANAFLAHPLVRPRDEAPAIGIQAEAGNAGSIIGIAYPYAHVGGGLMPDIPTLGLDNS